MVFTHFQQRPSSASSYYNPRVYPCTFSGVLLGAFWGCFDTFSMFPEYHDVGSVRKVSGYPGTYDNMGLEMNKKVIWNVK